MARIGGAPLEHAAGGLRRGLFAGDVTTDPVPTAPRRGRVRRWTYVAAGDARTLVGAAVVDLGAVGVAFAFATVGGVTATWERTLPLSRGVRVGAVPGHGAGARAGGGSILLGGDGSIDLDVPTAVGRLRADVRSTDQVTPATLATRTPGGGWNVTRKAAGTPVAGEVHLGRGPEVALGPEAGGWSDWTAGRQDRRTTWRWAAGAGVATDGRRVGINTSTGMNGQEDGEDVVWWDGVPHRLQVSDLAPADTDPTGEWQVRGPGTDLRLATAGVRSADERLVVVTSAYTQPFGRWTGTLAGPDGTATAVTMAGVAEDHLAVW
ncbi:DUF2804 family protein [Nitriliruptor alkaliphilus]|uniref:DUF2804 family protein n=1 Tax=Nitriliruptor alkaliphilus TaxID=427918 RepID=UPI000698ED3C|nr:DUF2804 family protein [Nitriliruptor alkaliphilus]